MAKHTFEDRPAKDSIISEKHLDETDESKGRADVYGHCRQLYANVM